MPISWAVGAVACTVVPMEAATDTEPGPAAAPEATAEATAFGGAGGSVLNGVLGNGGAAGPPTPRQRIKLRRNARLCRGNFLRWIWRPGAGAGYSGGAGGIASVGSVFAQDSNTSAYATEVYPTVSGGSGGGGILGHTGGNGASETLNNAVSVSTGNTLYIQQAASGGDGGSGGDGPRRGRQRHLRVYLDGGFPARWSREPRRPTPAPAGIPRALTPARWKRNRVYQSHRQYNRDGRRLHELLFGSEIGTAGI